MNTHVDLNNEYVSCRVEYLKDCKEIKITGRVLADRFSNVLLIAPNPIDKMGSYSGTGLPFPCSDIAFEGTKNISKVGKDGKINATFSYPNSYYSVADKKKIVSSVFFVFEAEDAKQEFVRFQLKDIYPLRTLINRETRTGPEFYSAKHELLHIDTAFEIMKEYAKIKVIYGIA